MSSELVRQTVNTSSFRLQLLASMAPSIVDQGVCLIVVGKQTVREIEIQIMT